MGDLPALPPSTALITAIILAGGRGSRMGEVDKGLQLFRGKPMVAHVLERLARQVSHLLVNANRNQDQYAAWGYPVFADDIGGYAGPLAGLHAGLQHVTTPLVLMVPCDSPALPLDLVARLYTALDANAAQVAVAKTFAQTQPVFCLLHSNLGPSLQQFLDSGQRKIDKWTATLKVVEVPFDDEAEAFTNINTRAELDALQGASDPG